MKLALLVLSQVALEALASSKSTPAPAPAPPPPPPPAPNCEKGKQYKCTSPCCKGLACSEDGIDFWVKN